ncbi:MAG: hypothetical protein WCF84_14910 [Anaerolineae bacterium]
MPLLSVPAIYDGNEIKLLEGAPVQGRYRVLVTFLEPEAQETTESGDLARFWSSFGAWQDDRPVEETLRDVYEARHSRREPPEL